MSLVNNYSPVAGTVVPILFIASRSDIAGGENYLLGVFRHMDRERFRPLVVLPGTGDFHTALKKIDVETVIVESDYNWVSPPAPWYRLLEGLEKRVRAVAGLIREKQIKLVHTNSNMILEGALAARLLGIHHVYMAHIEFQPNMPIFERFPLNQASFAELMGDLSSHIIAVSKSVADTLIPPLASEKVSVIHNGLELSVYDRAFASKDGKLHRELGIERDQLVIASAGRVHGDKGLDYLVQAAAKVLGKISDVHFVHAGGTDDGAFEQQLIGETKHLGIYGRFHFLGFRRDLPEVLTESDIFVLPSRREGHPLALLEAMASHCPAVASRCGGVEETMLDGVTGYVVDIGDVEALSERVVQLARDHGQRAQMATAAYNRIRQHFEVRGSVQALVETYEKVLALPRPLGGSIAVELFLNGAHELGTLGQETTNLAERVRQIEHFVRSVKQSLPLRVIKSLTQSFRQTRATKRPSDSER